MDSVGWECVLARHWTTSLVRALTCVDRATRDFIQTHPALGSITKISQELRLQLDAKLRRTTRCLSIDDMRTIDTSAENIIRSDILINILRHDSTGQPSPQLLDLSQALRTPIKMPLSDQEYVDVLSQVLVQYLPDITWLIPNSRVRSVVISAMSGWCLEHGDIVKLQEIVKRFGRQHFIARCVSNRLIVGSLAHYYYEKPRIMDLTDFKQMKFLIDTYPVNHEVLSQARGHLIRHFSRGRFDIFLQAVKIFPANFLSPRDLIGGLYHNIAAGRGQSACDLLRENFNLEDPFQLMIYLLDRNSLWRLLRKVAIHGHQDELVLLLKQEPSRYRETGIDSLITWDNLLTGVVLQRHGITSFDSPLLYRLIRTETHRDVFMMLWNKLSLECQDTLLMSYRSQIFRRLFSTRKVRLTSSTHYIPLIWNTLSPERRNIIRAVILDHIPSNVIRDIIRN